MQENNTIKTYQDYIPAVKEKFPYLSDHDIKLILGYGFRMLYLCNLSGCDSLIVSQINKFWFYIGELTMNPIKHFNYYKTKLYRKIQFIYRRTKPEWDGWYYTYINEDDYNKYFKPRKGRPYKSFTFKKKFSYKTLDACKLEYDAPGYIIKYKYPIDMGFRFYLETLKCNDAEVVFIKQSYTNFEDILTTNNNYEYL